MATSPLVQVDPSSLDTQGVSVATSPASSSYPRQGSVFNPVTFAAASPIWFHPLSNGSTLMISSRVWSAATPVGGTPGAYSAYTESTSPNWQIVNGPTGVVTQVPGSPGAIPMNTPATGVQVVAAVSRPPNLLFLLSSATVGGNPAAILQRFHISNQGSVALAIEEVLPSTTDVVFDKGLQYDTPSIVVYGTDGSGGVYKIAKQWGQVGLNTARTVVTARRNNYSLLTTGTQGWRFYTGTGYSDALTDLAAIPGLNSAGPLSFALVRNKVVMATVINASGVYTGQFWLSRSGGSFVSLGSPIALGAISDGSYLGGGLCLQPQLQANPAASVMTAGGVAIGVPYLTSQRTGASGSYTLDTVWNLLTLGL